MKIFMTQVIMILIARSFQLRIKRLFVNLKDEFSENILNEFVGVRSKVYAYKYLTRVLNEFNSEKKRKGLKKSVLKETMNFQHYLECIWKRKDVYREMNLIRNYKHEIFSETVRKKAPTAFDD